MKSVHSVPVFVELGVDKETLMGESDGQMSTRIHVRARLLSVWDRDVTVTMGPVFHLFPELVP
jgi:hypothetical protein